MAKKQRAKKQQTTLKSQKAKKLSKLANKYMEHFDNIDLLRKVGEKSDKATEEKKEAELKKQEDQTASDPKQSLEHIYDPTRT